MSKPRKDRPEFVADVCLEDAYRYLDNLRDSGVTNMLGAGAYLQEEYGLDKHFASEILGFWMKDCSKEGKSD